MRVLGAILAGGQATRFGSDKALALRDGRPLIAHAAAALRNAVADTIVCGRETAPLGLAAIPDWPKGGLGPLGGLCAALRHAADYGYEAVVSIGCDTPELPAMLRDRLIARRTASFLRQAPIIGYWPVDLAAALSTQLAQGTERSVHRWAATVGATAIDAGGDLLNINHATDLHRRGADAHG